jgi:hypothetical protein
MYTYPGNIHIHSTYSDGSGTLDEIAAAAASAGLQYLIITDHETLAGFAEEGFRRGVAVLVGSELNRTGNHYLALGVDKVPPRNESNPQALIDDLQAQNALGFIAHPFEKGSLIIEHGSAYPWTCWPVFNFTGIELWNYCSHWRGITDSRILLSYLFLFNRKAAMDGPPRECLQLWDCYTAHGYRVVAIGGTDAHAVRVRVGMIPVVVFPYEFLFRALNTYICLAEPLSGDFTRAKAQIHAALGQGNCYISFDQLHSGQGFSFTATTASGKKYPMGAELAVTAPLTFDVSAPARRSQIRLLKNGKVICTRRGRNLRLRVTAPGVYRAEVYYHPCFGAPRPWIYSNPIYLRDNKQ